jgi:hypothetical protein
VKFVSIFRCFSKLHLGQPPTNRDGKIIGFAQRFSIGPIPKKGRTVTPESIGGVLNPNLLDNGSKRLGADISISALDNSEP